MTPEDGLRAALLAGLALLCAGTVAELGMLGHTESPPQWIPFALAAAGLGAGVAAWWRPSRRSITLLRVVSVGLGLGAAFGMFEHVEHNLGFAAEIHPESPRSELVVEAIFGANPLLAPGIFAVMGFLGLAATWRHPAARGA